MAKGTGVTIEQLLHAGRVCNVALDEGPDAPVESSSSPCAP